MSRTPTAIPKKTKKQAGRKTPDGAARFNPISQEWKLIMEAKNAQEIISKKAKTRKGTGEAADKVPKVSPAQETVSKKGKTMKVIGKGSDKVPKGIPAKLHMGSKGKGNEKNG